MVVMQTLGVWLSISRGNPGPEAVCSQDAGTDSAGMG
jgi:hypothetical protein